MIEEFKKVAILENSIEASVLDSILAEQNVPHMIISYYDTAYDGLYQTQKGWGYISAPERYLNQIKEILASLRSGTTKLSRQKREPNPIS